MITTSRGLHGVSAVRHTTGPAMGMFGTNGAEAIELFVVKPWRIG
jgi:hypothetical protein